jgi:hypothetical protein
MHEPVAPVGEWLRLVVSGYYQYHAVPVIPALRIDSGIVLDDRGGRFSVIAARRGG